MTHELVDASDCTFFELRHDNYMEESETTQACYQRWIKRWQSGSGQHLVGSGQLCPIDVVSCFLCRQYSEATIA
jgi:hypothetical protein